MGAWILCVAGGLLLGFISGNTWLGGLMGGMLKLLLDRGQESRQQRQDFARLQAETQALQQRLQSLENIQKPAIAAPGPTQAAHTSESAQAPADSTPAASITPAPAVAQAPHTAQAPRTTYVLVSSQASAAEASKSSTASAAISVPVPPVAQTRSASPAATHTSKVPHPPAVSPRAGTGAASPPPSGLPLPPRSPAKEPPRLAAPSLLERGISAARNWLLGGNTVLRVGVVLLFLGLSFLLRYASERVTVPIELRYAGVALAAIALLAVGWQVRLRKAAYGLVLQGAGIAVLYLTVFAAMRLHPLISPQAAFGLLVAVTLASAMLAVLQNAMSLAAVAALGAFAAPVLTSTGSGNHVGLFSYFALLNAGIFGIAWFKAWRPLNLIGFFGTFGIGTAWGLRAYTPEKFASTEPFLILFFLMYVAIALLFARRRLRELAAPPEDQSRTGQVLWSARQTDYVDGTLLLGTPLVGFGLQYALIQHLEFGPAFSALALGLFYMVMARMLSGRSAGKLLLLVESCLALGVIFGTLAIPLGLDARWTSAAWAIEGAGLYWLGLRQHRPMARIFALALQTGAALTFLGDLRPGETSGLDGSALGALMLGAALLFSFFQLRNANKDLLARMPAWEQRIGPALACTGLAFLYLIAPLFFMAQATAIAWALAGLATVFAGLRLKSRSFLYCAFAIQLLGGALFLMQLDASGHVDGGVLLSGWQGLLTASLIGLALMGGMWLASRDPLVRDNPALRAILSIVLLGGLALINLAVLFVLPWRSASAVWAGTGLLIVWLSLHWRQRASFVFGLVLQLIGGTVFLFNSGSLLSGLSGEGLRPLAHAGFWTPAVLALAAFAGAWRLMRASLQAQPESHGFHSRDLARLSQGLLVWGALWWAFTGLSEILRFVAQNLRLAAILSAIALSVAAWIVLAVRERWRALALLCLTLLPAAALVLLPAVMLVLMLSLSFGPDGLSYHPAAHWGWLGWLLVFVVHGLSMRRLAALAPDIGLRAMHVLGCWLLLVVLGLEARHFLAALAEQHNAWRWLGWALVPSAFLALMGLRRALPWPVAAHPREYRGIAAAPVAAVLLLWFWGVNLQSDGAADPLPYLPLVNPLELGMLIVLAAIYQWTRNGLSQLSVQTSAWPVRPVLGASLFALLTMMVCRTAHHWAGVSFDAQSLSASMAVQAGLSIVWTLCALGLMIFGHLRRSRIIWMTGAVLIALVVLKLFFVDLGGRGSLERIISFIGVGVMLLVVGYFAPLPPARAKSVNSPTP